MSKRLVYALSEHAETIEALGKDGMIETNVEIIDMITKDNVEMYGADGWQ